MPKYDVSKLLFDQQYDDRFLNALDVDPEHIKFMKAARTMIRNKLKSSFTDAKSSEKYLARLSDDEKEAFQSVDPRFSPQGSFAYKTQNEPAQIPPQQLDIDDGVYLPIEVLRGKPVVNKEIFFSIVDDALKELAKEQGWLFKEKNTCARIELDHKTHIDIPLYAIPEHRHAELQKAQGRVAMENAMDSAIIEESIPKLLEGDTVYLAKRDGSHWVESDPIHIQEWFQREQHLFGPRLTRVCRYFKAWRDHRWQDGELNSIALMICVWNAFVKSPQEFKTDSEAILAVCKILPAELEKGVKNPVNSEEVIFPKKHLAAVDVAYIISAAKDFSDEVIHALENGTSNQSVLNTIRQHWGQRIPNRLDLILSASVVGAQSQVSSAAARKQSKPQVNTMRAGHRAG